MTSEERRMKSGKYNSICEALAEIIKGSMFDGHVYAVGGCVRDEIMEQEMHDIDLAIDLPNGGIRFARWLEKSKRTARNSRTLGRSVIIYVHFGTAKVRLRQFPEDVIDCVQMRKGRYEYDNHPHPEENFGTIEEDALCRDLTINSLYRNISTRELLDPTGYGLSDIQNQIIRTPNDPDISLLDNPMHILRCIRFACRYGWDISPTLLESMKRNIEIIAESSHNRIVNEVTSILALNEKKRALKLISEIGADKYVQPVIEAIESGSEEENRQKSQFAVSSLEKFTPSALRDIDNLMHELSPNSSCPKPMFLAALRDKNTHIYVVRDRNTQHIIGSACLCVSHTTEHVLGFIEAVVVSEQYRGLHLGRQLMERILKDARQMHIDTLHLTSNPRRGAANSLYQNLGFERYETNVYKLRL